MPGIVARQSPRSAGAQDLAILAVRYGAIAQLAERLNGIQKVKGSNPFSSTITSPTPTT